MRKTLIALAALVVCALPLVARADWNPCDPDPNTKFYQLPDPVGLDVKVTTPNILADDFVCFETGWITDVHFWGSWQQAVQGEITRIHLSFHADVPAGDIPYSHPGELLWDTDIIPGQAPPGSVVIRDLPSSAQGWYDPNTGEYNELDHSGMVQVNIFLDQIFPLEELFIQRGSAREPIIYWLDLQVDVAPPVGTTALDVDFGWKTSLNHFGDDAVWGDYLVDGLVGGNPLPGWQELLHPRTGESLDMAFVITGIPIPEPGVMILSGMGLLALLARRRKK